MNLNCRLLEENEIASLGDLTGIARNDDRLQLWEDRSPDFLTVYRSHIFGVPRYYGIFDGSQLVGCSGLLPTRVSGLGEHVRTYLDSDLFLRPEYRKTKAIHHLIAYRRNDFAFLNQAMDCLTFGVENWPGLLEFCAPHRTGHGVDFFFPSLTRLTQVFLIRRPVDPAQAMGSRVQFCSLAEAPLTVVDGWLQLLANSRRMFSPIVDRATLTRLLAVDPNATLFWIETQGEVESVALLFNEETVRRFRIGRRPGLMFERLRKERGLKIAVGDILPISAVTLAATSADASKDGGRALFRMMAVRAYEQGRCCLLFRDTPEEMTQDLGPDIFCHERRLFAIYDPETLGLRRIHENLVGAEHQKIAVKLESPFL